jgi:hypothetical protein
MRRAPRFYLLQPARKLRQGMTYVLRTMQYSLGCIYEENFEMTLWNGRCIYHFRLPFGKYECHPSHTELACEPFTEARSVR